MYRLHSLFKKLPLIAVGLLFVGCASQPMTPEQVVNQSSDPQLAKQVMQNLKDKKYDISYHRNLIEIHQYISGEKGHTDPDVQTAINEYINMYDSSKDKISQIFIETAKKRGDTVKLYKYALNDEIARRFNSSYQKEYCGLNSKLDVAFIEYDHNNRIRAILVRRHVFESTLGITHDRYSDIIFGRYASIIEETIPNNKFNDNLISVISTSKQSTKYDNKISKKNNIRSEGKSKKLKDFYNLYKEGAITKEEYEKEKNKILNNNIKSKSKNIDAGYGHNIQNILLQKYNEKYGTNFKNFKEMQEDLIKRKINQ